jgi:hypothetical protein
MKQMLADDSNVEMTQVYFSVQPILRVENLNEAMIDFLEAEERERFIDRLNKTIHGDTPFMYRSIRSSEKRMVLLIVQDCMIHYDTAGDTETLIEDAGATVIKVEPPDIDKKRKQLMTIKRGVEVST